MTGFLSPVFWLALALAAGNAGRSGKTDPREESARAFFAAAKYQEAIDIYAQLFAQYVQPDYIYNIGRCYQNLGDPDRALTSFREFIRKSKRIDPALRKELDGHIKEMEALKAQRDLLNSKLSAVAASEPSPSTPVEKPAAAEPAPRLGPAVMAFQGSERLPAAGRSATAPAAPHAAADAFVARMRAAPDRLWRERALKVDAEKLGRTERMVSAADARDPRLGEYLLHLATQFAGKHFTLRLQELEGAQQPSDDSHKIAAGERTLGPAITASFAAATDYYVAAAKTKGFGEVDEALFGLAVLLQANNMADRARSVLLQLLHSYPESKWSEEVRASVGAE
jgi:tetratricopeptide (TPR) repeat protein